MSTINLAEIKNDNRLTTPYQALLDAAEDIKSGKRPCDKILILTLDTTDDKYRDGFYCANMKVSEMLALCCHMQNWFNSILDGA